MGIYTMLLVLLVVVAIAASLTSKNNGLSWVGGALALSLVGSMFSWWVLGSYFPLLAVFAVTIIITSQWKSPLAHLICVLYGVRVGLVLLVHYGAISVPTYQEVNSWFVIAQAGVAIWGALRNGGIRTGSNGNIGRDDSLWNMGLSFSKRFVSRGKKSTETDIQT